MELSLGTTEGFENDRDLDFETFRYALSFRTPIGNAGMRPLQLPAMLALIFTLHGKLGITGLLSFNLQRVLARYVEQTCENWGNALFDTISNQYFVDFEAHLEAVEQSISDVWTPHMRLSTLASPLFSPLQTE